MIANIFIVIFNLTILKEFLIFTSQYRLFAKVWVISIHEIIDGWCLDYWSEKLEDFPFDLSKSRIFVYGHYSSLSQRLLSLEEHVAGLLLGYHELDGDHFLRTVYLFTLDGDELETTLKAVDLKVAASHHLYLSILDHSDDGRLHIVHLDLFTIIDSLLVDSLLNLLSDLLNSGRIARGE